MDVNIENNEFLRSQYCRQGVVDSYFITLDTCLPIIIFGLLLIFSRVIILKLVNSLFVTLLFEYFAIILLQLDLDGSLPIR